MKELTKIFKALGDSNRLRILKMLEIRELCVCEITVVLKLANSTVSKHLSVLRDAELILDEKDGKWVNYRLAEPKTNKYVTELIPLLKKWLPNDKVIKADFKKVKSVNRNIICNP